MRALYDSIRVPGTELNRSSRWMRMLRKQTNLINCSTRSTTQYTPSPISVHPWFCSHSLQLTVVIVPWRSHDQGIAILIPTFSFADCGTADIPYMHPYGIAGAGTTSLVERPRLQVSRGALCPVRR